MRHPLFTVLVPTYNQAPYLGAALDSLLAQTCADWEAVIVNDGSTDSTPQVLADYAQEDDRFRIYHKENGGAGSALNVGLEHAHGEWICWLSSDDFFESRKLEIHRDWINKHPEDRFFFTHFKEFNEVTGKLSDPPLWSPIPEREWQVIEMLHHTYVHGNSICVQRELWSQAGRFDTELRYGQDYDMWLRLAALSPARFIPERTCVTRVNPSQLTHTFPEAPFYDCAKSGINFLNQHTFAQLFPAVNLNDPRMARRALLKTLEVAQNPYSFIYRLGAHPLIVLRMLQWLNSVSEKQADLRRLVRRRAADFSRQYRETPLGLLWTITNIAMQQQTAEGGVKSFTGVGPGVSPTAVAEAEHWRLRATNPAAAVPLRRYLERFGDTNLSRDTITPRRETGEVLFICHPEAQATHSVTMRQLIDAAKSLMRDGHRVILISLGESGMRVVEGVLVLNAPDKASLVKALKSAGPLDTLIETPGAEVISGLSARRALVYRPGSKSAANGHQEQPAIFAVQGSRPSPDVDIAVSDSANWSDIIGSFAPARHSSKEAGAYLRKRMTQVKRKVRDMASR